MKFKNKKVSAFKKSNLKPIIILFCIILSVYLVTIFIPLVWGLIMSFKPELEVRVAGVSMQKYWKVFLGFSSNNEKLRGNYKLFDNYKKVIEFMSATESEASYFKGFNLDVEVRLHRTDTFVMVIINTLLYAGVGAFIMAIVPCVMGYMCAKYRYKFSEVVYILALVVAVMPSVAIYPTELVLLRRLSLYDNMIGNYIQKFSFCGTYFFVFLAFFKGLGDTYAEAAEVDGASQLRILIQIIIPLASKIIFTVTLINFITLWNDYQTPLLYLPTHPTLCYALFLKINTTSAKALNELSGKTAGCMLLAVPILVMFIFLKDKIMGNVTMGGVKE